MTWLFQIRHIYTNYMIHSVNTHSVHVIVLITWHIGVNMSDQKFSATHILPFTITRSIVTNYTLYGAWTDCMASIVLCYSHLWTEVSWIHHSCVVETFLSLVGLWNIHPKQKKKQSTSSTLDNMNILDLSWVHSVSK